MACVMGDGIVTSRHDACIGMKVTRILGLFKIGPFSSWKRFVVGRNRFRPEKIRENCEEEIFLTDSVNWTINRIMEGARKLRFIVMVVKASGVVENQ